MKILATVIQHYLGQPNAVDLMYLAFTQPLRKLGHTVEHFDHITLSSQIGNDACGQEFVKRVRSGGYDLVLYQTGGGHFMPGDAIVEAGRFAPIVAWNSDDDWQWETYSKPLAPLFTFMVTTYPHVYEANRIEYSNLRLSQWAALDIHSDFFREKDLDFTFAGQVYFNRVADMRKLWWRAGLKIAGMGRLRVFCPPFNHRGFREKAFKLIPSLNRAIGFDEMHQIWNRSKISYTPMNASRDAGLLQIKSRAFEMGLSGTLMLSQLSPNLDRYYEPGREFVVFENVDDCIEKVRYYLSHEAERRKIAEAYCRRTRAEHMWEHRFDKLFADIGVKSARLKVA